MITVPKPWARVPSELSAGGFRAALQLTIPWGPCSAPLRDPQAPRWAWVLLVGGEGDRGPEWTRSHSIPETSRSGRTVPVASEGKTRDRPAQESPLLTAKGHRALWAAQAKGSAHPRHRNPDRSCLLPRVRTGSQLCAARAWVQIWTRPL